MSKLTAYRADRIFDGHDWHEHSALLVEDASVVRIVYTIAIPHEAEQVELGGLLVPGFIDLQVNGGGGALLNEVPTLDGITTICKAHYQFGTTALLPTLITDTAEVTARAIAAGREAEHAGVPGFLGLHLEGPHLSLARKGAHDPKLIRPMEEADLLALIDAFDHMPNLLTTVAPENVTNEQIARLVAAGIVVSLGHTDASYAVASGAAEAGASMATHVFNAMSQLGNREPGVVGAALDIGSLYGGIIADGIHVDAASMGVALRGKRGPAKLFLVTDAMSMTGTDETHFTLNGREILRKDGALRLADGTLAGADLTMIEAVTNVHRLAGVSLEEALRMATLYPAEALDIAGRHGHLHAGAFASFVSLSSDLKVQGTWIEGERVFG